MSDVADKGLKQIRLNAYRYEWLKTGGGDDADFERWLANRCWEVEAQRDALMVALRETADDFEQAIDDISRETRVSWMSIAIMERLNSARALLSEQPK